VVEASDVLVTGNHNPEFAELHRMKRDDQALIDFSKPTFDRLRLTQLLETA